MGHRSSNRRRNAWAVALLDVQRGDRVLEIGFGPGVAIQELSRRAVDGYVCGIDHSEVMLRQATMRNAEAIQSGRVELRIGSVESLPPFEGRFDSILAVNVIQFLDDATAQLAKLRHLLRPGGRIAVVLQPRSPGATDETTALRGQEIAEQLAEAGFSAVRRETLKLRPAAVCALGVNEAGP